MMLGGKKMKERGKHKEMSKAHMDTGDPFSVAPQTGS